MRLPSVVVPGLDTVLDIFWDAVGRHVFDSVVHARAVVSLTSSGSADHVPHLDERGQLGLLTGQDSKSRYCRHMYLSNHDREGEDSDKVVDELKDNLKEGGWVRQAADGDQRLHSKVVTANVTKDNAGERDEDA